MDVIRSFKVCGSGLAAQRAKLDVVSSNLANVSTTRTPEGGPYKKKAIAFAAEELDGKFNMSLKEAVQSVKVDEIREEPNSIRMAHDPGHPDADANGFVAMPDINVMQEMADMIAASRAFEACVTAFDSTKSMTMKTLEMGR